MKVAVPTISQLHIKSYYGFRYLLDPDWHQKVFEKLGLSSNPNMKVLDLYPGPGIHSAVLYNKVQPQQYTMMECRRDFLSNLRNIYTDGPMELVKKDPYKWESYTELIDQEKLFVPKKADYNVVNKDFYIMANLTEKKHEGLLMQWMNCVGNRNWLFRFGRSPMLIWMPTPTASKLLADSGDHSRHKCSLVREAFTDTKLVALSQEEDMKSFNSVCLDKSNPLVIPDGTDYGGKDFPIALVEFTPKKHDIDLDNWEFVTKHLMVLYKTPLIDAIDCLGHGARDYFSANIDKDHIHLLKKCPQDFTNNDFVYLTNLFHLWPFKPDVYMDFLDIYQEESRE
ncbi:uncharacterized protein GVI51_M11231 [Nakaseomyces glabratus]|uniref:Mitochondrial transcription factor 1 n=2 Tax=Candida glabrata TaxID=5478 RepID=Q6FIW3_CANGA|nr:uncharacterized protein CAGL0M11286g [Nakaseomyces glabratus]KAH7579153.1 Ribosomal RNA adenine dimethylase [Nakaseomyces glabratus]KAH7579775.1 Ribosomal RNA adenine dimethylase [Nakaseomyces glabratus]KAH7580400.1 Ribosomal RNA adenine dimethylase [Nakaseomyces glabratus]KAH7592956.1 Ribosomal RNA adenine dimethylase [Nakaseomyces glabratus]KAH7594027.1 Ribosomal RNA adenine dimethylase [Nakaseomyces glabratus]|eukprot:XP_449831.1 uncharacterized protein CAGL0M11286g [[Candida] glabrata]